jgi:hypothetical protein
MTDVMQTLKISKRSKILLSEKSETFRKNIRMVHNEFVVINEK